MLDLKNALEKAGCMVTSQEYQEILDEFKFRPNQVMDFEGFKEVLLCKEYLRLLRGIISFRLSFKQLTTQAKRAQAITKKSYHSTPYSI